jgi:glutathione S-transferase
MDWQFHFADAQRDAFLGCVRQGKDASDPAVARSAEASGAMMRILDAELATRPWLSGDRFGIADIPMGVYAHTFSIAVPRPMCRTWPNGTPGCATPGYASQVMIPLT